MGNGANHSELLVVFNFTHEAKVNDAELAIISPDHISWMGVGMEEPSFQQLH